MNIAERSRHIEFFFVTTKVVVRVESVAGCLSHEIVICKTQSLLRDGLVPCFSRQVAFRT